MIIAPQPRDREKNACPIARFEKKLLNASYSRYDIEELESKARAIINDAVAFADRSKYPEFSVLDDMVYSERF